MIINRKSKWGAGRGLGRVLVTNKVIRKGIGEFLMVKLWRRGGGKRGRSLDGYVSIMGSKKRRDEMEILTNILHKPL